MDVVDCVQEGFNLGIMCSIGIDLSNTVFLEKFMKRINVCFREWFSIPLVVTVIISEAELLLDILLSNIPWRKHCPT